MRGSVGRSCAVGHRAAGVVRSSAGRRCAAAGGNGNSAVSSGGSVAPWVYLLVNAAAVWDGSDALGVLRGPRKGSPDRTLH